MRRIAVLITVLGVLLTALSFAVPVAAVVEHCPDGWTSKDETGDDGDLVLAAGTVFCVKGGTEATGILVADGETTLAEYLIAAGISGGESYFAVYPTPSPTPSPSPSPSGSPPSSSSPSPSLSPTPSPSPTGSPPVAGQFSVETCPTTGELVIPEGSSAIRFRGAVLLILLLNVRIDGELVTLQNTFGDGTVGDRIVTPGVHTWSISNAADTEVLASGDIFCPECSTATVSPPSGAPVPPTTPPLVPNTAMPLAQAVTMVAGIMLSTLGLLLLVNALAVRRRKED